MREDSVNKKQKVPYDLKSQILVVDDDLTILKFFKIHLNKFFSHVSVASNAFDAVEILKNTQIDLVISDVNMPKMSGVDLMHHIVQYYPTVLTILISGASLSEFQKEDVLAADGYMRKPFSIAFLNEQIKVALKGQKKLVKLAENMKEKQKLRKLMQKELQVEDCVAGEKKSSCKKILADIIKVQEQLKKTG